MLQWGERGTIGRQRTYRAQPKFPTTKILRIVENDDGIHEKENERKSTNHR